jgi:hypothetical protein
MIIFYLKYYFLNLLVAPGVIAHELAHAVSCLFGGVKIFKMKLFRFGNPAGYVEHAIPEGFFQSLVISAGPLVFNTLIALLLFSKFEFVASVQSGIALWLGLVVGLHAIPSMGDVEVLWKVSKKRIRKNPLVFFGLPFVLFLYTLNILKRWHIHFVYALFLFWLGSMYLKM